jgi:hypothetical protein
VPLASPALPLRIGSAEIPAQGSALSPGEVHELCPNLRFDVQLSDSGCALLHLQGGADCLGAERILLVPPLSPAIRIGAGPGCELRVPRVVPPATLRIADRTVELEQGAIRSGPRPVGERFDFVLEPSAPPVRLSILPV